MPQGKPRQSRTGRVFAASVDSDASAKCENEKKRVVDPARLVSVRWPTSSPRARASIAPTISQRTRVDSSPITTSGWKLAGGADCDVGQTDHGREGEQIGPPER